MKNAIGLLLFAALPTVASADQIFIDYEGTVSDIINDPDTHYAIGDRVAGRLTIDTALAGPNMSSVAGSSLYGANWGERNDVPDFITGFLLPSAVGSDTVRTGNVDGIDHFFVSDDVGWGRGEGLDIEVAKQGLLRGNGDALAQSFELVANDVRGTGEFLLGMIREGTDETVNFAISHLSVRPGRCSVHT